MKPNIAFFDSGQGGLTIWEKVVADLPNIKTVYLGDNARCPYGNKSPDVIVEYTRQAAQFLKQQNAKFVAIVCGTASSVATEIIKNEFDFPVMGIVECFCEHTAKMIEDKNQTVVILATHFTIQSQKFQKELQKHGIVNTWAKACPLFVPLVEHGISEGPIMEHTFDLYLHDFPNHAQAVMLACTHYPRIINCLAKYLAKKTNRSVVLKTLDSEILLTKDIHTLSNDNPIYLLEASFAVTKAIQNFIQTSANKELFEGQEHHLYCTDDPNHFLNVAQNFTKQALPRPELVNIVNRK